jgi:hypothetical protein
LSILPGILTGQCEASHMETEGRTSTYHTRDGRKLMPSWHTSPVRVGGRVTWKVRVLPSNFPAPGFNTSCTTGPPCPSPSFRCTSELAPGRTCCPSARVKTMLYCWGLTGGCPLVGLEVASAAVASSSAAAVEARRCMVTEDWCLVAVGGQGRVKGEYSKGNISLFPFGEGRGKWAEGGDGRDEEELAADLGRRKKNLPANLDGCGRVAAPAMESCVCMCTHTSGKPKLELTHRSRALQRGRGHTDDE